MATSTVLKRREPGTWNLDSFVWTSVDKKTPIKKKPKMFLSPHKRIVDTSFVEIQAKFEIVSID